LVALLLSQGLLNSLDIAENVVGLEQIFLLKALQLVLPQPEDLTVDGSIVARFCIAPECLIIRTVQAAETTAEEITDNNWYSRRRFFAHGIWL